MDIMATSGCTRGEKDLKSLRKRQIGTKLYVKHHVNGLLLVPFKI